MTKRLLLAILLGVISAAPLWGSQGHEITGLIAQRLITSQAFSKIKMLIPQQNGQLAQVANWADQIRSQPAFKWSSPLHFADVPDWACDFIHSRDCADNMCVVGAVANYTTRQNMNSLPMNQKVEALKFFVHFAGDIHQPLHVGFLSNLGGNSLQGKFMGKTTNLHSLWDSGLLTKLLSEKFGGDQNAFADYLSDKIQGEWSSQAKQWRTCTTSAPFKACPVEWAEESAELACNHAYVEADGKTPIKNNFNLGQDYYDRNIDVVEIQLAKSGVRMANVLNSLYPTVELM